MKKIVIILVCFLLAGISLSPIISSNKTGSKITIYVDDDANSDWYDATHVKTIQEGINNASTGDVVSVKSGIYSECIFIDKKLTIIGENKDDTIISGNEERSNVLTLLSNSITITGFTIQNGGEGWSNAAIFIGIYGAHVGANNSIIKDNIIKNNLNGIWLMNSYHCEIFKNSIKNNFVSGITIYDGDTNLIEYNLIENNAFGIVIAGFYNQIQRNDIIHNSRNGVLIGYNKDYNSNQIYQNNFIGNTVNAHDHKSKFFVTANNWKNNYWNEPRLLPYAIPCDIIFSDHFFPIPWFVLDINPAKNPF